MIQHITDVAYEIWKSRNKNLHDTQNISPSTPINIINEKITMTYATLTHRIHPKDIALLHPPLQKTLALNKLQKKNGSKQSKHQ